MTKELQVIGIGNAIVDIIAEVGDDFLSAYGGEKGSMSLVDAAQSAALYANIPQAEEHSGGSAANTMAGFTGLGGVGAYIGKVKNDQLGKIFSHDLRAAGVAFNTKAAFEGPDTANSIVLVTPDAERTMHTYLGACMNLTEDDVEVETIKRAAVLYIEGYLWDLEPSKRAILKAVNCAKSNNTQVSLTLSDSFCVHRFLDEFRELIQNHVDILFANEAELSALMGGKDLDAALELLRPQVAVAAITRGDKGAVIISGGQTIYVDALETTVIDTTGAGDLFAAGFLYGLTSGKSLEDAGKLGCAAAAKTINTIGARPSTAILKKIAKQF